LRQHIERIKIAVYGKLPLNERYDLEEMLFNYHYNNFEHAYHLTMQPRVNLSSGCIRPDMLIWKPSSPKFKLLVECDGFEFHSQKNPSLKTAKEIENYK
jgi:hypothetical protein